VRAHSVDQQSSQLLHPDTSVRSDRELLQALAVAEPAAYQRWEVLKREIAGHQKERDAKMRRWGYVFDNVTRSTSPLRTGGSRSRTAGGGTGTCAAPASAATAPHPTVPIAAAAGAAGWMCLVSACTTRGTPHGRELLGVEVLVFD